MATLFYFLNVWKKQWKNLIALYCHLSENIENWQEHIELLWNNENNAIHYLYYFHEFKHNLDIMNCMKLTS